MRHLWRQMAAFLGVGVISAIGHYGILVGAVEGGGLPPVPATLLGFVVGGLISYLLNRRYTFRSHRAHADAVPRFTFVAAVGFLLTGVLMTLLTGRAGLHYLPAQLVTSAIVMGWSFCANRAWTFRPQPVAVPALSGP